MKQENIRNFSIIAHIDHGKSTLADRILELTNTISKREMKSQLLDDMDIEQERGITIKLNAVQLKYKAKNGEDYIFHLIDTPGHVDFAYEVSRSLAACEGALLVVDAAQGVEAQTLANVYLALDNDLEIIPVINKIDLPNADPKKVKKEIEETIGLDTTNALFVSAKTGVGVEDILESIIKYIPSPKGNPNEKLQALIFDSYFDAYRGVILSVCVKNGTVKVGDKIKMMATKVEYEVTELGVFTPHETKKEMLTTGEVGWLAASIKNIENTQVGDTITHSENPALEPLPGYKRLRPMVFCGLYPIEGAKYNDLRDALQKLKLNDSALEFEPETSHALGFDFVVDFRTFTHGNYRRTLRT